MNTNNNENLKYWFGSIIAIIVFLLCLFALHHLEKEEKEQAIKDGRNNICYTSTGDRYYCE